MPFNFEAIHPEEVLRDFLQSVRKEGSTVRVITALDPISAGAAGLIARLLKSLEIDFELSSAVKHAAQISEERVIGINIPAKECSNCIIFEEGSNDSFFKAGSNSILKYTVLQKGLQDLVSEFDIVPKKVKTLLAATLITKHIPRLRKVEVKGSELNYLRELCEEGILKEISAPPIIGWGILPNDEAVKLSIDALIPAFFMKNDVKAVDLNEVSKALGIPKDKLLRKAFKIEANLGIDDLYMAGYTTLYLMDTLGPEGLSSSFINTRFWRWGVYWVGLHRNLLREVIDSITSGSVEVVNKYLIVKADPSKTSATLIKKVLEGVFKDLNYGGVVLEWGRNYYVPQELITELRISLKKGFEQDLWRGYVRAKNIGISE